MTEPTTLAIDVQGLSKRYGRTLAIENLTLAVPENTLFALLGPNGAGKTTLIHILTTILEGDGGKALVGGIDIKRNPVAARRNIGVVFQDPSLDDRLTAFENLDFHGLVYGVSGADRRAGIDELLALVELEQWRNAPVRTYSSGMKRRLEIARALLHRPRILFLDEPTVGLDAQSRARIWSYLAELRRRRPLTIIVTTHYIEEVEGCDLVSIIDHGKIIAEGTPEDLKRQHGHQSVRVMPADAAAAEAITAAYPAARKSSDGSIVIEVPDDTFAPAFLARFGTAVQQIAFEKPSLESVFLAMTGRELRDRAAEAARSTGGRRRT